MSKDVVVIYSGGMDSYTLVALTHGLSRLHSCVSFNYGQKHAKELDYAKAYCAELGVLHNVIDLRALRVFGASALTSDTPVPEGHYADDNMKQTVVPNRNTIMLSIAIAHAVSQNGEAREVHFGAHAGDHTIYPDCRREFVQAMDRVAMLANWIPIHVAAPFINMTKAQILELGHSSLQLDYSKSWTCYAGRARACGRCGSCQERLEGFASIGRTDPLMYEADDETSELN